MGELDLSTIASETHGYVGGDLRNIVMESIMQVEEGELTKDDLETSLAVIKPAALRDSAVTDFQVRQHNVKSLDILCKLLVLYGMALNTCLLFFVHNASIIFFLVIYAYHYC